MTDRMIHNEQQILFDASRQEWKEPGPIESNKGSVKHFCKGRAHQPIEKPAQNLSNHYTENVHLMVWTEISQINHIDILRKWMIEKLMGQKKITQDQSHHSTANEAAAHESHIIIPRTNKLGPASTPSSFSASRHSSCACLHWIKCFCDTYRSKQ